ncbi:hypothetical protein M3637_17275 [Paenibacillus illinoisensis]|nr:hypothetical protein [Paenibacillus illinoisensis]
MSSRTIAAYKPSKPLRSSMRAVVGQTRDTFTFVTQNMHEIMDQVQGIASEND